MFTIKDLAAIDSAIQNGALTIIVGGEEVQCQSQGAVMVWRALVLNSMSANVFQAEEDAPVDSLADEAAPVDSQPE